jgi:hypothetical protein
VTYLKNMRRKKGRRKKGRRRNGMHQIHKMKLMNP